MKYICITCNKRFVRYDRRTSGKYCSLACYNQYRREHPQVDLNCKCLVCNKKFHLKPASIKQGMGKYCSRDCKHYAQREAVKKENETYNDRHLLRQSSLYRKWRRDALKLHKLKCDNCGRKQHTECECCGHKTYLHVHHVEKFASNVKKRFDPTNSSVLCARCHRATE